MKRKRPVARFSVLLLLLFWVTGFSSAQAALFVTFGDRAQFMSYFGGISYETESFESYTLYVNPSPFMNIVSVTSLFPYTVVMEQTSGGDKVLGTVRPESTQDPALTTFFISIGSPYYNAFGFDIHRSS